MDPVTLSTTELDFLKRLLLEVQREASRRHPRNDIDDQHVAGLELALALLRWDGSLPPNLDAQYGLGAAVEMKLGADAMCAYRQWRNERRKARARQQITP